MPNSVHARHWIYSYGSSLYSRDQKERWAILSSDGRVRVASLSAARRAKGVRDLLFNVETSRENLERISEKNLGRAAETRIVGAAAPLPSFFPLSSMV